MGKTDHANYEKVWNDDRLSASHHTNGVESVENVVERCTGLIMDLESAYNDKDILLVSHGDASQVLQTGFQKVDPRQHRSLQHLETAEIRQLTLAQP
ncbi:histidine phosphatase family protein [Aeromicrobium sp.]|nr:histidine phosphatase family protein [Candidatus Saccharibacteria bacterium]